MLTQLLNNAVVLYFTNIYISTMVVFACFGHWRCIIGPITNMFSGKDINKPLMKYNGRFNVLKV